MIVKMTVGDSPKTFSLQGHDADGNPADIPVGTVVTWGSSDEVDLPLISSTDTMTAIVYASSPGNFSVGAVLTLPNGRIVTANPQPVDVSVPELASVDVVG